MDEYSAKTMEWLDARFRRTDADGVYIAHQPIYGFRAGHCEPGLSARQVRTLRILEELSRYKIKSLLDVGAAEGYKAQLSKTLLGIGKVECCDLSAEAAKRAKEIFGIKSRQADIHSLPYKDREFDAVLCSETLEHVYDQQKALEEILRVAGKIVIITVPNETAEQVNQTRRGQAPHGHINAFTGASFDYLKASGWSVFHRRILSSRLKYLRKIVDADRLVIFKDSPLKKIFLQLFNFLVPLFRVLANRYVVALSFQLDALFIDLFREHDAHLFLLVRNEYVNDRAYAKNVSALDILNFSVPLFRPGTQAAVR
jgi:ubiquinone/menaquinone biosynthesis C-methylase UbiE